MLGQVPGNTLGSSSSTWGFRESRRSASGEKHLIAHEDGPVWALGTQGAHRDSGSPAAPQP